MSLFLLSIIFIDLRINFDQGKVYEDISFEPSSLVLQNGRLIVLEKLRGEVHVYSEKYLEPLNSFGKRGQGPGEWLMPVGMHVNDQKVDIFDGDTGNLLKFGINGQYFNQIKLTTGYDISFFSSGYIVQKLLHQNLFHHFNLAGDLVRTFGAGLDIYETLSEDQIFKSLSFECTVAIDEKQGILFAVFLNGERIEIFELATGKLLLNKPLELTRFSAKKERRTGSNNQGNVFYFLNGRPVKKVVFLSPFS